MEICSSYLTLAGSVFGKAPRHGLKERSEASFKAGFTSIGASLDDMGSAAMPGRVADLRLAMPELIHPASIVAEVEWFDLTRPNWDGLEALLGMADTLGTVRRINVGSAYRREWDDSPFIPESNVLRTVASMALDHGIGVCVEPVAFGAFPTLDRVMSLIKEAGGVNMGILYDTWHVGRTEGHLPYLDASAISAVQISGTSPVQTRDDEYDAMCRTLPSEGIDSKQVGTFLHDLLNDGYNGPICAEVPTSHYRLNSSECESFAVATYRDTARLINDCRKG